MRVCCTPSLLFAFSLVVSQTHLVFQLLINLTYHKIHLLKTSTSRRSNLIPPIRLVTNRYTPSNRGWELIFFRQARSDCEL